MKSLGSMANISTAIEDSGGDPSGWYTPSWTLELDDEMMSLLGSRTTILSVTAPGACILKDSKQSAQLARDCNEFAATICNEKPGKYGFFACLPSLFDTKASLDEITYALDTLKADGVTLYTRYGEGHAYLGHESFRPIWEALSSREAVVFIHPTHAADTHLVNPLMPQPVFDYPHETGRTAMDLISSGTLREYRNCKVILSHAGGDLPYLIHRAASVIPYMPNGPKITYDDMIEEARNFYFDTALSANPITMQALLDFAKPGHVFFGSDFPNAPRGAIMRFTDYINGDLSEDNYVQICYSSALKLFPRLAPYFKEVKADNEKGTIEK